MPSPYKPILTELKALVLRAEKEHMTDLAYDLDETLGHYLKRANLTDADVQPVEAVARA